MVRKNIRIVAGLLTALLMGVSCDWASAQVVAPSTWATGITIAPQPRDENGVPTGSPSDAAFDDWDSVPLAVSDPADNPSVLNIIDIGDVKIANDADYIYIYVSGHKARTKGVYLAFDTDQNIATGFNIYGLDLVGSELGYVSDFVFDQRTSFNDNKPDASGSCCIGGPLDLNNGGAGLYPGWDVEFGEREWAISLDAMYSVNAPLGPVFPNSTFNFIVWTDQGLSDVTDTITYTLATPSFLAGDYNSDGSVNAADYSVWRDTLGSTTDLRANGDNSGASAGVIDQADYAFWQTHFPGAGAGAVAAVPEPTSACLLLLAVCGSSLVRRR
ncbi:MAG: hypothetical protein AB7G28_08925 [Pirellulales bacterium]